MANNSTTYTDQRYNLGFPCTKSRPKSRLCPAHSMQTNIKRSRKNTGAIVMDMKPKLTGRPTLATRQRRMSKAWARESERKNIQQSVIPPNTNIMWPILTAFNCKGVLFQRALLPAFSNNGMNNTPHRKPQTTKVQFAPCQSPQSVKTISVLKIVRRVPLRLPPKGIYKYSVNHDVSEICQPRQNSDTVRLKYGKLKLRIMRIPKSLPVPIAMSE